VNFDAGAWNALAREVILLGLHEDDLAIDSGVDREVAAHERARTSNLGSASLANKNFTGFDGLATKAFDTKALASIVVDVLTGTTSFDM
jgi:hypothetical protein